MGRGFRDENRGAYGETGQAQALSIGIPPTAHHSQQCILDNALLNTGE